MGQMRNAYEILLRGPESKYLLRDDIRINIIGAERRI